MSACDGARRARRGRAGRLKRCAARAASLIVAARRRRDGDRRPAAGRRRRRRRIERRAPADRHRREITRARGRQAADDPDPRLRPPLRRREARDERRARTRSCSCGSTRTRSAIAVMSIPRDLKVDDPRPRHRQDQRRVRARRPALTVETIKQLFAARRAFKINHVVNVNFGGFREAVDTSAASTSTSTAATTTTTSAAGSEHYAEIDIQPGYQKLCGQDALDYVRFRHARQRHRARRAPAGLPARGQGPDQHSALHQRPRHAHQDLRRRAPRPTEPALGRRLLQLAQAGDLLRGPPGAPDPVPGHVRAPATRDRRVRRGLAPATIARPARGVLARSPESCKSRRDRRQAGVAPRRSRARSTRQRAQRRRPRLVDAARARGEDVVARTAPRAPPAASACTSRPA